MLKNNGFHNRHSPFIRSFGSGATLALDFTSGNNTLDPRITFSRTTNATVTGSNGLIQNAPMNLLTFSEQFDNAAWGKTDNTVTANAIVAPDGAITAELFTEGSAGAASVTRPSISLLDGSVGTYSIYLKRGNTDILRIVVFNGANQIRAWVNVATGQALSSSAGGTGVVVSATLTAVGNDWYRLAFVGSISGAATGTFQINSATSDGGGGRVPGATYYLWGAQQEIGSTATTYNPTTVKNLLGFTENFDNAAWTKSNATITSGFTDIYGQPFAQQITATGANATVLSSYTAVASTPYTFSVYLQRVSGTGNVDISIDGTTWVTQTLTTTLQRFSVTGSPTAGAKTPGIRIVASGDVVVAFGAQLSDSASVDPYVYQPVAAPASTAYYGPRFDYDPVTLAPKGLLIEEQRTNLLLNTSILGTQVVTVTAAAHTLSFYGTGTIVLSGAFVGTVTGTGAYPTRTTLTFTPIVGVLTVTVTGSVTSAQLEAGSFATSYIPTVASQVTRAVDSASMIGNNFARWFNVNEGTFFFNLAAMSFSNSPRFWSNRTDVNNRMLAFFSSGGVPTFFNTNATVNDLNLQAPPAFTVNTFAKTAQAYALNNAANVSSGGTVTTDTSVIPYTAGTTLVIGDETGSTRLNGWIARIAYYNRRLSNTELQGITA